MLMSAMGLSSSTVFKQSGKIVIKIIFDAVTTPDEVVAEAVKTYF